MARTRTLDVIEIEEPCSEDWDRMIGSGSVRFCQLCRFNVYDLRALTEDEIVRLVTETEGRLCVQVYRRADGTVVTADCAPARFEAARRVARRSLKVAAGMIAAMLTFVLGLAGLLVLRLGPKETSVAVADKLEVVAKAMVPAYVTEEEPPHRDRPMLRGRISPRWRERMNRERLGVDPAELADPNVQSVY